MSGRLRDLIEEKSLARGDFALASGRSSGYFFNMKTTMLDPEGLNLIADAFIGRIAGESAGHVGGIAMGAVPIVSAICAKSLATPLPRRAFFVRKERKDHGMERQVDGYLPAEGEVLLFEDVTTTGGSAMIAVEAVRQAGCTVRTLYTVVDRLEGAEANLAREGIRLDALFTRDDFVV